MGFFGCLVKFKFFVFREVFKFEIIFFFGFLIFFMLVCFENDKILGVLVFLVLEGFNFFIGIGGFFCVFLWDNRVE